MTIAGPFVQLIGSIFSNVNFLDKIQQTLLDYFHMLLEYSKFFLPAVIDLDFVLPLITAVITAETLYFSYRVINWMLQIIPVFHMKIAKDTKEEA